jgi:hypothetical protein
MMHARQVQNVPSSVQILASLELGLHSSEVGLNEHV